MNVFKKVAVLTLLVGVLVVTNSAELFAESSMVALPQQEPEPETFGDDENYQIFLPAINQGQSTTKEELAAKLEQSEQLLTELDSRSDQLLLDENVKSANQSWSNCMLLLTDLTMASPTALRQQFNDEILAAESVESLPDIAATHATIAISADQCAVENNLASVYQAALTGVLAEWLYSDVESRSSFESLGLIAESPPASLAGAAADFQIELTSSAIEGVQRTVELEESEGADLMSLVSAAGTPSDFNSDMSTLNGVVFYLSYKNWKWYAKNGSANGRAWYPQFDWSTDECSFVGNGPWDFKYPCMRHDLSWRNLKNIESTYNRDAWNGRNKNAADRQFKDDLYARCGDFAWYIEWACYPTANIYFEGVNILWPYAAPWDKYKQGFVW